MLRAILNKSRRHHPTKQQLYGHLPPITKTIQIRRTRYAGHCWRRRDELISDVLLWTSSHGRAKAGWPARSYIQQFCADTGCSPETCLKQWTIGRGGERGSGIFVLIARHDDKLLDTMALVIQLVVISLRPVSNCQTRPRTISLFPVTVGLFSQSPDFSRRLL